MKKVIKMNLRENLFCVLRGKKPENVPWFADLSWWYHAEKKQKKLSPEFDGDGIVNLYRYFGCGIYLPLVSVYRLEIDCKMEIKHEGNNEIRTYLTPYGELREVIKELPDTFTVFYEERLLKSGSDLKALKYFLESINYYPEYSEAERLDNLYDGQGTIIVCLPRTPLSRFVVELAGIEATTYAAFESPAEFNQIIKVMEKKDDEAYKIASKSPGVLVMFPDNLSSEVISPRLFSQFSLEYYQYRNQELHENGKITTVHIDGTLRGLLPVLARSGVDCVEGLTPYPIGDTKPEELRQLTNHEMVLWGGIPGVMFTKNWKMEAFESYVHTYLEAMKSNYRFVLGVGDQVPPNSEMERVKRVSEIVGSFNL